jgi:hypothetical protein
MEDEQSWQAFVLVAGVVMEYGIVLGTVIVILFVPFDMTAVQSPSVTGHRLACLKPDK